jgi:hypothetical protein
VRDERRLRADHIHGSVTDAKSAVGCAGDRDEFPLITI